MATKTEQLYSETHSLLTIKLYYDEKFAAYARVSKKEGNLRLVKKIGYHSVKLRNRKSITQKSAPCILKQLHKLQCTSLKENHHQATSLLI